MDAVSLPVEARTATGKGYARKLRRAGSIPAVVYRAGGSAEHITLKPADIELVFRQSNNRNTLLKLEGAGVGKVCLVRDVQRHPVSRAIRHVDLYEVDTNQDVRVTVNVVPVGTSMGVKAGGKLQVLRRYLEVICKPQHIPESIAVDVTNLDIAAFAKMSALTAPEGCAFPYKTDFNLVTVIGKRVVAAAPVVEEGKKKKK